MYEIVVRSGNLDAWTNLAYTDDYGKALALVAILSSRVTHQIEIRRLVVV